MKISKPQLFRYFRGEAPDELARQIDEWLGESKENEELYREASVEYEWLMLNADIDSIRCAEPAEVTRRKKITRTVLIAVANVAAIAVFFFLATFIAQVRIEDNLEKSLISSTAQPGQIMSMTLTDGTSVQLNSGTTINYPPLFTGKKRTVYVEGEAYFNVSHNEKQPFLVKTYASDIEVLGTKFNVNADKDNGIFSVTLAEGSVKVTNLSAPDNIVILKPDEKVTIINGKLEVAKTRAKDEIRWKDGIIDIEGMDFNELMDKLEMAFGVEIIIERDTLPELRFTSGRLRISDGIEYALKVLQNGSDFTWKKDFRTGTIHIR